MELCLSSIYGFLAGLAVAYVPTTAPPVEVVIPLAVNVVHAIFVAVSAPGDTTVYVLFGPSRYACCDAIARYWGRRK